ncbi:MAG: class I SAM-dependent methyltransferase [Bacteroidetes bacterium]|nr:class I SAM-dependent methyltransferase [Bacteroidota bacterium]
MYSSFQLAKKYLHYYFTAANGKGHGVHSPFVFDFIAHVLNDKKKYDCYQAVEERRKQLLKEYTIIEVEDFGAGSSVIKTKQRVVKDIAASSLKSKKFGQLLFRMVQHYQPKTIIELGTSFGITTSYLAKGNGNAAVHTCEGSSAIAAIATQTFHLLKASNINLTTGDFSSTLRPLLSSISKVDFAFIDGNHRKASTLEYFEALLQHAHENTLLIFDDIHWSADMEAAWSAIQQHPAVTLTIDLFFIGIVSINPGVKARQHFSIRF